MRQLLPLRMQTARNKDSGGGTSPLASRSPPVTVSPSACRRVGLAAAGRRALVCAGVQARTERRFITLASLCSIECVQACRRGRSNAISRSYHSGGAMMGTSSASAGSSCLRDRMSSGLMKWRLLGLTLPWLFTVLAARGGMWYMGYGLFTPATNTAPIITASVFVAAQLMAGVLSDWKESERAPGLINTSLVSILGATLVSASRANASPAPAIAHLEAVLRAIIDYLDGEMSFVELSRAILDAQLGVSASVQTWGGDIRNVLPHFTACQSVLARMEQIEATSFVSVAYGLHDLCSAFVILCCTVSDYGGHAASFCMLCFFTALFVYLSLLLRDLDSPFTYPKGLNRRCLEALTVVPRGLHETHSSCVDFSLVAVSFATLLTDKRRAVEGAGLWAGGAGALSAEMSSTARRRAAEPRPSKQQLELSFEIRQNPLRAQQGAHSSDGTTLSTESSRASRSDEP